MEEQHAWLVRPMIDGVDYMDVFREQGIIATKVPGTERNTEENSTDFEGKSEKDLRTILSQPPYSMAGRLLGNTVPQLDRFMNGMQEGDFVLVPDGETIHFAIIESKQYHPSTIQKVQKALEKSIMDYKDSMRWKTCISSGEDSAHSQCRLTPIEMWILYYRKVHWLTSISRDALSPNLRKLLMNRRQIADLSTFYDEIAALSRGEDNGVQSRTVQISYPLRDNFDVKISLTLPSDITHTEAKRLGHLVENTFFEGDFES